jgi:hypothetical protein
MKRNGPHSRESGRMRVDCMVGKASFGWSM